MNVLDAIDRIPMELQGRLEMDAYFADIPVVVAEEGNIALELERRQAVISEKMGRIGTAVLVLQMVADDSYAQLATGPMLLRVAFQVLENIELNRGPSGTGKTARQIARRVRDVIKPLALWGIATEMVPDKPCIEPVNLSELGPLVKAYQVNFTCYEAGECEAVVGTPGVAQVEGQAQLTFTCGTEGAEVWYSVDDSYPGPGRAGSVLWDGGTIDIPVEGLGVRAVGYKVGMIASQVARYAVAFETV